MKILYIPMDERPCNYKFPMMIAEGSSVEIVTPDKSILGNKRSPADVEKLWNFVENNIDVDFMVLSLDMLIYGGLIPSRLHNLNLKTMMSRLNKIRNIRVKNPSLKIYCSQCIMRSPQYNSGEEEPEYYEEYGYRLFRRAYLQDKLERSGLSYKEQEELNDIIIPDEILIDYEQRRLKNEKLNEESIVFVYENVIDFLIIPQDDSSPYGYTAKSQSKLIRKIENMNLEQKILIYPGADEVGSTLISRVLTEFMNYKPKLYVDYSSSFGPLIVPLYEDRPFNESLKHHAIAAGYETVENAKEADIVLAYNTPGKRMEEAEVQPNQDLTYNSYRNLSFFTDKIQKYTELGKKVVLCDSAYSNGGDLQLYKFLEQRGLTHAINAYAGWNTNCNSLGTVLASGVYNHFSNKQNTHHLVYRIIEDVLYQSIVRKELVNEFLPRLNISYFDLYPYQKKVEQEIEIRLNKVYKESTLYNKYPFEIKNVSLTWDRMFEVDFDLIKKEN